MSKFTAETIRSGKWAFQAFFFGLVLCVGGSLFAQDYKFWTGYYSSIWEDGGWGNWEDEDGETASFSKGDAAFFGNGAYSTNVDLSGAIIADSVTVTGSAYIFNGSLHGGSLFADTLSINPGASLTLEEMQVFDSSVFVTDGATLELTAAKTLSSAPLQGGELEIVSGGTLQTNFIDYGMNIGDQAKVYLASGIDYQKGDGVNELAVPNWLYKIDDGLKYESGTLYYSLQRVSATETLPNLSPSVGLTLDDYRGGNNFIDDLLETTNPETPLQSGFDLRNLSAAASAVYEAKGAINRSIDARALDEHITVSGYGYCGQCGPTYGYGSSYGRRPYFAGRTELWGSFLYDNARGFGLNSGNFKYGYTNDLYGVTFGLDKTNGGERIGIMGAVGWSNIRSYGGIADTKNDTGFGGVYGYLNERFGEGNLFMHIGWLGMSNDIAQFNNGDYLSGRMDNGLFSVAATLSQLFCLGGLHVTPSIGIEYGYYYQTKMNVVWGDELTFADFAADANLLMIPIGVRLNRDMPMYNGILRPEIRLRYIANVSDTVTHYNTWVVGSNTPAPMIASISDRHVGDVGVGIGWTEGMVTINANYAFLFSENRQNHLVSLTGLWKF